MSGYLHRSAQVFSRERERIFTRDWLCVARVDELPEPGDYLALRLACEPVLVTRNRAGEVRAFSNMCAHRGAEIATGAGNVKSFSCPYHGWGYDLDGRLAGAAYMAEATGFDRTRIRLPPLQVGLWQGWIFVNFDAEAAPLEDSIAELSREFGFLQQGELHAAARFELTFDCNWKQVIERIIGVSIGLHRRAELFPQVGTDGRGGLTLRSRTGTLTDDGVSSFGAMDTLASEGGDFAALRYLPPNLCMGVRSDHVHQLVVWPVAPDRSRLVAYLLFPQAFRTAPDFPAKVEAYCDTLRHRLTADAGVPVLNDEQAKLDEALGTAFRHYVARVFA